MFREVAREQNTESPIPSRYSGVAGGDKGNEGTSYMYRPTIRMLSVLCRSKVLCSLLDADAKDSSVVAKFCCVQFYRYGSQIPLCDVQNSGTRPRDSYEKLRRTQNDNKQSFKS
jgi:hypothetical protein